MRVMSELAEKTWRLGVRRAAIKRGTSEDHSSNDLELDRKSLSVPSSNLAIALHDCPNTIEY